MTRDVGNETGKAVSPEWSRHAAAVAENARRQYLWIFCNGALKKVMKKRPDVRLDLSDALAPITFLKVQVALSAMKAGQLLEVICIDEETRLDLSSIIKNSDHQVVSVVQRRNCFRFLIRKGVSGSEGVNIVNGH